MRASSGRRPLKTECLSAARKTVSRHSNCLHQAGSRPGNDQPPTFFSATELAATRRRGQLSDLTETTKSAGNRHNGVKTDIFAIRGQDEHLPGFQPEARRTSWQPATVAEADPADRRSTDARMDNLSQHVSFRQSMVHTRKADHD